MARRPRLRLTKPAKVNWAQFSAVFTIGAALTALFAVRNAIDERIHLWPQVYYFALWAGVGCILVAIVWSLGSVCWYFLRRTYDIVVVPLLTAPRFACRAVRENELDLMHEYWARFFGEELSSIEQDRDWFARNDKLFWFLLQTHSRAGSRLAEPKVVGSFSLLPLCRVAADQVAKGELVGSDLKAEHLLGPRTAYAAVYVGGVLADGVFARGELLGHVYAHIDRLREKQVPVFARPVTRDGLRLVEKYGFLPAIAGLSGLKNVYRLAPEAETA